MDSESSFEDSDTEESKSSSEKNNEESKVSPIQSESPSPTPSQNKKAWLKDYEMLGILGEGAFGKVHHVVRKADGEQFALKVLTKKNMTK